MGGECDSNGRCWHGNVFPNESHAFWAERFGEAKARFGSKRSSSLCLTLPKPLTDCAAVTAFWNDHMAENMDQYEQTSTVNTSSNLQAIFSLTCVLKAIAALWFRCQDRCVSG